VKFKALGIGLFLLAFIGCASIQPSDPIDIYQKTRSYRNVSFDDVWAGTLRSVDEMEFIVKSATKKIGLIHAEPSRNPDPRFLPPVMNIIIIEEDSRVMVNFHIELPGQRNNVGIRKTYTNQFFRALRKNL
jgi:hypothetical protein